MQQAEDFREVSRAVEEVVTPLTEEDFSRTTGFKDWTIDQILRHLHVWNYAAHLSLTDEPAFKEWMSETADAVGKGSLPAYEESFLDGLSGHALLRTWADFYPVVADAFAKADPSRRVAWAGPSMSARSSITARLMETWAHAQAIYDELGIERHSTDAIRNIVVLGLNTYGWTFANRAMTPPEPRPRLVLTAPSGEVWEYGDGGDGEKIEGSAEEFCQVVTQTRNIADTDLVVTGPNATQWMSIAQCFAGPPNDPPRPGERRKRAA